MIDPPPHLLRVTSLYMNRDDFYRVGQGFIVTGNKMEDRCQHQPDQLNCKCSYFGFYPANNSKAKREVTGTDLVAHDRLWEIRPSVFNSNLSWWAMARIGICREARAYRSTILHKSPNWCIKTLTHKTLPLFWMLGLKISTNITLMLKKFWALKPIY